MHSPESRLWPDELLEWNALPAKGKWSATQREREAEEELRQARQQRPAVAAGIHQLEQHGLERVRTRGQAGCERTAALGANRHRLGRVLLPAERPAAERRRAGARQGQLCQAGQNGCGTPSEPLPTCPWGENVRPSGQLHPSI